MDSKDCIITCLKELQPSITEDLLISMSNKGTVNRGKKDLEKLREELKIRVDENQKVKIQVGPEAEVTLAGQISACSCSCPSASVCRHMITALLFAAEYQAVSGDEPEAAAEKKAPCTSEDFSELNALTAEDLKKLIGKKDYNSFILSLRKKNEAVFDYGDLLKTELESQGVTVYFPSANSVEGALCSCKARGFCRHKGYALTAYLMTERGINLPLEEEAFELTGREREFLEQIKTWLAGCMDKGMASLTDEVVKEAERNYIRAYGLKLFRMADELKWLSSDFSAYFSKHVSFSNTRAMHLVCKLYNRADALLCGLPPEQKMMLVGKRKEDSFQMNGLKLWGMGAAARMTKRKDLLLSAYFYSPDLREFVILSTMRPTEGQRVRDMMDYLYQTGLFWEEEFSLNQLCGKKVELKNGILTDGRLSGTKNSSAKIMGTVSPDELEQAALMDFDKLRKELEQCRYQYFSSWSEARRIYLVKIEETQEAEFDTVRQKCRLPVMDRMGEIVTMEIPYSEATITAIGRLEQEREKKQNCYILGEFYEQKGQIEGTLLNILEEGRRSVLYL